MNFGRQLLIYGIAGAVSRLTSFLLVPLYTRTLDQTQYGELEILISAYMFAVLMIGLQGESAVARDYFLAKKESREREVIGGALIMACGGLVLTVAGAAVALAFGVPPYVANNIALLLLAATVTHLMGIQLVVVRFAEQPGRYATLSLVDVVVTSLSSLVFILGFKLGIAGALAGLAVGKAVVVAICWPSTFGLPSRVQTPRSRLRAMAAYSLPTMPAVLLNWLQTIGNRIVWSAFFPLGLVAIASVGMRVAAAFGLLVYAFRLAWEPFAFRLLDEAEDVQGVFSPALNLAVLCAYTLACCAILGGPLLVAVFAPPQYRDAASLVGILVMSQVWLAVMLVTQMGIHGARVTSRIGLIYLAGTLVNFSLMAISAPYLGLSSTAWGTFAGTAITALGGAYFSNRHFDTGFSIRLLGVLLAVTFAVGAAVSVFPAWRGSLWPHPVAALAAVAGIAVLWLTGMGSTGRLRVRNTISQNGLNALAVLLPKIANGKAAPVDKETKLDNR